MTALYVFGAFLVLLLAGVVLAPLVEREPPDEELEELPPEERHEAAVEALAEVEFEYRTEKLPEEEYRRLRARYGRIALAAEEEMEGGAASGAASGREGEEGATAGTDAVAAGPGPSDAGGGESDARGSGSAGRRTPRSCPECGTRAPEGARFCPGCGARRGGHGEA